MKKRFASILPALLLLPILTLPLAAQGIVWETTTTYPDQKKEMHERSSYMPGMIRQDNLTDNVVVVFRLDKQLIRTLIPDEKSYSELTFQDMDNMRKKMSGQMEDRMKKLNEQMASMSESERKQMEEMMGGKMKHVMKGGTIDVTTTGKKETIAGFSATEYLVTKDGEEFAHVWASKDVPNFAGMNADMKEFIARMASMMPKNGGPFGEGLKKVEGFPMIIDIKGLMKMKVTKVEKKNTSQSEFDVPPGFKKEDLHYGG